MLCVCLKRTIETVFLLFAKKHENASIIQCSLSLKTELRLAQLACFIGVQYNVSEYRQPSLSQTPRDQKLWFEIIVVTKELNVRKI